MKQMVEDPKVVAIKDPPLSSPRFSAFKVHEVNGDITYYLFIEQKVLCNVPCTVKNIVCNAHQIRCETFASMRTPYSVCYSHQTTKFGVYSTLIISVSTLLPHCDLSHVIYTSATINSIHDKRNIKSIKDTHTMSCSVIILMVT